MAVTAMEVKVKDIVANGGLPKNRKVDELRKLQSEARGIQRAGTEGPMSPDDGLQDDLRVVEKALHELGADIEEKGPASL
ncbi:hypothetical protein [Rhizobium tubonense]|uniref:Uncharacterized protein n=1 Tax=Rhizobium tubonense TaxID=484088 RepID=A0A2W4ERH1_9HYPH|nr:hypothetical protein [Rhizobium tubonense]PZM16016.1 hypothetical protein CPY51_04855 [Rhizobium tubonense]